MTLRWRHQWKATHQAWSHLKTFDVNLELLTLKMLRCYKTLLQPTLLWIFHHTRQIPVSAMLIHCPKLAVCISADKPNHDLTTDVAVTPSPIQYSWIEEFLQAMNALQVAREMFHNFQMHKLCLLPTRPAGCKSSGPIWQTVSSTWSWCC